MRAAGRTEDREERAGEEWVLFDDPAKPRQQLAQQDDRDLRWAIVSGSGCWTGGCGRTDNKGLDALCRRPSTASITRGDHGTLGGADWGTIEFGSSSYISRNSAR